MLYLSQLIGRPVRDQGGDPIGSVADLIVAVGERYPPVTGVVVAAARRQIFLPWTSVESVDASGARLNTLTLDLAKFSQRPNEILLKQDLMDKQIVDIDGRRVVRVNDLSLDVIEGALRLVAVDVGASRSAAPAGHRASNTQPNLEGPSHRSSQSLNAFTLSALDQRKKLIRVTLETTEVARPGVTVGIPILRLTVGEEQVTVLRLIGDRRWIEEGDLVLELDSLELVEQSVGGVPTPANMPQLRVKREDVPESLRRLGCLRFEQLSYSADAFELKLDPLRHRYLTGSPPNCDLLDLKTEDEP